MKDVVKVLKFSLRTLINYLRNIMLINVCCQVVSCLKRKFERIMMERTHWEMKKRNGIDLKLFIPKPSITNKRGCLRADSSTILFI